MRYAMMVFAAATMSLWSGHGSAQPYPAKPIRIITAEVGGGNDFTARLIAQGLTANLGQQVIVENRGGASGAIAAQLLAKAAPDGYTLLSYTASLRIAPFLRDAPAFDPSKEFVPISLTVSSPNILVVHPSLPAKSAKDLINLAKAKPGQLNYGSGSSGSTPHLAAELFKAMAGVNIVRISYRGNGAAYSDLIGGQIQVMFATTGGTAPHVKSGRLRPLATTSAEPSALLPGLPTVAASGLPGYESVSIVGAFAPLGTHHALIMRINQEIANALNKPDIKDKFFTAGVETVGSTPEKLTATIHYEMTRLGKVIKDAGIRAD